ncbi:hypothetical protein BC938DRAFT_478343, partial [Jimgerdemannia flammicorona]
MGLVLPALDLNCKLEGCGCLLKLSSAYLDRFSSCVTNSVPATQASSIFDRFTTEFFQFYQPPPPIITCNGAGDETPHTKSKKRKLNNGQLTSLQPSRNADPISIYLIHYLRALRLTTHQKRQLEPAADTSFERFISPVVRGFGKSTQMGPNYEKCMLLPALRLHFAFVDAFPTGYWVRCGKSKEWIEDVGRAVRYDNE